jgi:curved DNA-binding protein CbpA
MGKIHTHYDNLKVSRMAPQEVIRAAYKALSQKYHPDKNPGDEKAARIMAILNSAYDTLSDTQRRKEHDEWIAAEEWEIEWLESTRHESPERAWSPEHVDDTPRRNRRRRDWKWWAGLATCLALGFVGGVTMMNEPQLSSTLTAAWGSKANMAANAAQLERRGASADAGADGPADPKAAMRESWASSRAHPADGNGARLAPVKVMALSQVVLPNAGAECDTETQTLVAPNGEPWPAKSGYVEGFPVGNKGEDMELMLDNAANASAVFIKVYDTERRSNVRYAYVRAHDKLQVDKLSSGKYEIRYQNLDIGANPGACGGANRTAANAEAATPPASN